MRALIFVLLIGVGVAGVLIARGGGRDASVQPEGALGSLTAEDRVSVLDPDTRDAQEDRIVEFSPNAVFDGRTVLTEEEYAQHKVAYYCELATTMRENCEAVWRGADAHEQCLQLNQYYSYSRHCGERP